MTKIFNTTGYCDPEFNYMVDLSIRLAEIKNMVDSGMYFTINRARQFGKTTTLTALADYLEADYEVISMDFQTASRKGLRHLPEKQTPRFLSRPFLKF